ncbi:MAG: hypothetical protein KAT43_06160 [Nanoarchaeota archaeon]|nr:hypothetical protein [Nanoarchaeota archaeon]
MKGSTLLETNHNLRALWEGRGKTNGDLSKTGYEFSLVRKLLRLGVTDVKDLAAILANRPGGSVIERGKGSQYITATIAGAIKDLYIQKSEKG